MNSDIMLEELVKISRDIEDIKNLNAAELRMLNAEVFDLKMNLGRVMDKLSNIESNQHMYSGVGVGIPDPIMSTIQMDTGMITNQLNDVIDLVKRLTPVDPNL